MSHYHRGVLEAPCYTHAVFDPNRFSDLVCSMVTRIEEIQRLTGVTALAACGNSGLPLVGAIAALMRMPFYAVRKGRDPGHDSRKVNGFTPLGGCSYLIIDDLISSGTTVKKIYSTIRSVAPEAKPGGILLYTDRWSKSSFCLDGEEAVFCARTGSILKADTTVKVPVFFVDNPVCLNVESAP